MGVSLSTDIMYLTGVGPKRAELLKKELNITTFGDLLYFFPYKYVDRSKFYKISEITGDLPHIQIVGQITLFQEAGVGRKKRLTANFTDGTGVIELVWFKGLKWVAKSLKPQVRYVVFGEPTLFGGKYNIAHPEIEEFSNDQQNINAALQAAYSTTEKLKSSYITSRTILKFQQSLAELIKDSIEDTLPSYLLERTKLITLSEALKNIHFPGSVALLQKAQARLKFEELFYVQLNLLFIKSTRYLKVKGHVFSIVGDKFNKFYHTKLPFELTNAQKIISTPMTIWPINLPSSL